uniref:NADH dehydrogenase [ubiquinone] 1 alpha subcomplex subunit 11 n=1 Tax=Culicoides sonorensis TaxID=179676 RepID=A0A336MGC7_CULSO
MCSNHFQHLSGVSILGLTNLERMAVTESKTLLQRRYYDQPEGEDMVGKLIATNKWAVVFGVAFSTVDVLLYSRTKGYLATMSRYLKFTAPLVGVATAFTCGTFLSTRMRGKDDNWNYMVGAVASGGVLGAAMRCPQRGLFACGAFCLAAWVKRLSIEEGWVFFPEIIKGQGDFNTRKHDWSIVPDGTRGWTRGN